MKTRLIAIALGLVAFAALSGTGYAQSDNPRNSAPAIGVNLAWAGISTPNLSFEVPVNPHFTIGASAGLKAWPRWSPFDMDRTLETKWKYIAALPYVRWWPNAAFDGYFIGVDALYAHYNVGSIKLPLGIYPDIAEYRVQGDFYGAGVSLGYSVWLTRHLNLVLSAGAIAGYKNGTKYDCPWCGAEVGPANGAEIVPKLDVSISYHLFNEKRAAEKKNR